MKCATCGKENEDDQLFCIDCGQELKENEDFPISETENSMIKKCPRCQSLYDDSFDFCGKCGYSLKGKERRSVVQNDSVVLQQGMYQVSEQPKKDKKWLVILAVGAIVAFVLGYWIAVI